MPRETEMDEVSIKTAAKQFDLSLVFKLTMPQMGLKRIANLHLVPNVTVRGERGRTAEPQGAAEMQTRVAPVSRRAQELDLSGNRIGRMDGLSGLESLKRLVLANNEISRIEGVETLDALETLQLQGNRITNLDDAQCLTALPCLRHLQFQSHGGQDRNPMCEHPAYRSAMRRMLPTLQTLDGERALLADAALPRGAANALEAMTFAEPTPWLRDFDWGEEPAAAGGRAPGVQGVPIKGAAEFDSLLTECKRLSAKAQSLVEDYRARTPR